MLPFAIRFKSGKSVYEQVLLAVKRALISGQLKPGDRFPSTRALSQELRINPNTAHRIVSTLAEEGILTTHPRLGAVVGQIQPATARQKQELLDQQIESLILEARMVSLDLPDLLAAIQKAWDRLVRSGRE
jgi:GntR family transcriptional regulator